MLAVDLVAPEEIERLPDARTVTLDGVKLPCIRISPFECSAPAKIRLSLAALEANRSTRDSIIQP